MRRLWERMAAMFPNRWTSAAGASPQDETGALTVAGDTWARGLAGITVEQLSAGLRACVTACPDGWPPSLPEFRGLCLGIPTFAEVQLDLRRKDADRHPFTVLTWSYLDSWSFARADTATATRMLRDAYGVAHAFVMGGGALPERPAALLEADEPAPVKPASPEVARAALAELRASLGVRSEVAA